MFYTGGVPILFSLPQVKNLGMAIELDPKGVTRGRFERTHRGFQACYPTHHTTPHRTHTTTTITTTTTATQNDNDNDNDTQPTNLQLVK